MNETPEHSIRGIKYLEEDFYFLDFAGVSE